MKKLLFVINSMSHGGIQKALINLLNELSQRQDCEITLLLINRKGELLDFIPSNIKVIEANCFWKLLETSNDEIRKANKLLWLVRGALAFFIKNGKKNIVMSLLSLTQKKLLGYDCAISYRHPELEKNVLGGSCEFVLNCCKSQKKIVFIHCDYSRYGGACDYNNSLIERFDKIAVVSESCKNILLDVLPHIKNKTYCVYNCHNYKEILNSSENFPTVYSGSKIEFVTVCRLAQEKGLERTLQILAKLKKCSYKFKWHIVGDGEEHNAILKMIKDYDLVDEVVLEGKTTNPHKFVKNADFFLLPSYHEAAPMVIGEAFALGVPVVTTRTASADELVKSDFGFICENTTEGIYEMLKRIFDNTIMLDTVKSNLSRAELNNKIALEQFEQLIN